MQTHRTIGWSRTRTAILWIAFFLTASEALHLTQPGKLWLVPAAGAVLVAIIWIEQRRRLLRTGAWRSDLPIVPQCKCSRCVGANGQTLLGLCLLTLLPAIIALFLISSLFFHIYSFVALRWRWLRAGQRFYLICSPRHGWRDSISNNLSAVLPASVVPIWIDQEFRFLRRIEVEAIRYRGKGLPKPCLIEIKPLWIRARSLHSLLLPLKPFGRKDLAVQHLLSKLLEDSLRS